MKATPLETPEKVSYTDPSSGTKRVFYKQMIALHDTEECPSDRTLTRKKMIFEFAVEDENGFAVDETFTVSATTVFAGAKGRPTLGRLVPLEAD